MISFLFLLLLLLPEIFIEIIVELQAVIKN